MKIPRSFENKQGGKTEACLALHARVALSVLQVREGAYLVEKRGRGWGLRGRGSGADNIHQGLSFLTPSPGSFRWRRVWFFFPCFFKIPFAFS